MHGPNESWPKRYINIQPLKVISFIWIFLRKIVGRTVFLRGRSALTFERSFIRVSRASEMPS